MYIVFIKSMLAVYIMYKVTQTYSKNYSKNHQT